MRLTEQLFRWQELNAERGLDIFCDAAIRLNPPAASAAAIAKNENGQVLGWFSRVLPAMPSIEAEYHGLFEALELARQLSPLKTVCLYMDNQAVVGQVTGRYAVRQARLKPLHAQALKLTKNLRQKKMVNELHFFYLPREYNLLADALAADALLVMPRPAQKFTREWPKAE